MSGFSDIWDVIRATVAADAGDYQAATSDSLASGVPQAVARDSGWLASLTAFVQALTDGRMWASLGWLLLGVGLIIAGVMLWLKQSDALPPVVPIPLPL